MRQRSVDYRNWSVLAKLPISVPSVADQRSAVLSINAETTVIDAAIVDAREAIALSKERRAALISAAVTGQIDVTDRYAAEAALDAQREAASA